jgi:two-component system response regulator AtoC
VLLVGESGTGKEMFSRKIHLLSKRSGDALIKVSCASLTPMNFASVLGLNSTLDGSGRQIGTIFFDEIGELDAVCQRSLLYALPDGDGVRTGTITARIVSTTTEPLDEGMQAGRFRSQLYYRINGVCLQLPALRERREDIPLLVEFFLTKHAEQLQKPRPSITPGALRRLLDQPWRGNVRELENAVKKIVALGDEDRALQEIKVPAVERRLPEVRRPPERSLKAAARAASRQAERELILQALARTRWNRRRAAQELQISYKSLLLKLKQIGFDDSGTN